MAGVAAEALRTVLSGGRCSRSRSGSRESLGRALRRPRPRSGSRSSSCSQSRKTARREDGAPGSAEPPAEGAILHQSCCSSSSPAAVPTASLADGGEATASKAPEGGQASAPSSALPGPATAPAPEAEEPAATAPAAAAATAEAAAVAAAVLPPPLGRTATLAAATAAAAGTDELPLPGTVIGQSESSGSAALPTSTTEEQSAAQQPRQPQDWAIGDAVMVVGLKSRPELNGKHSKIADKLPNPGGITRYLVQVSGMSVHLAVKPENLQRDHSSCPAEQDNKKLGDSASSRKFGASFDRLRAKAEVESSQGPGFGKGKRGRQETDPDAVLHQPLSFVPAEEDHEPIRKVTVIDPRGRGVGDGESDDDTEIVPGRIKPPKIADPLARCDEAVPVKRSWAEAASLERPSQTQTSTPSAMPQGQPLAQQPQSQPVVAPQPQPEKPPVSTAPHITLSAGRRSTLIGSGGNLTLTVSQAAMDEDQAKRDSVEKRVAAEEKKKKMLATLTNQIKLCLTRLQAGDLDDNGREKYQDMVASLNAQMEKVSGMKT